MKKLKLPREIAGPLLRQKISQRSHAEQIGPTVIRFYHKCGHTSVVDFGKQKPFEWKPLLVREFARRWHWTNGGVNGFCLRCYRAQRAEAKRRNLPFMKLKTEGRVGPDWEAADE